MDWTAKPYIAPNTLHCVDAFELLAALPDASVDMCLTDMPYGTTACSWDTVIDLDAWWVEMRRVMKPRGAVVCTGSEPFSSVLRISAIDLYKYDWIWYKTKATDQMRAKLKPLNIHENISVFSKGNVANCASDLVYYYPQKTMGKPYTKKHVSHNTGNYIGFRPSHTQFLGTTTKNEGDRLPTSVIRFANGNNFSKHPTQKPVALFEYLIKTYTNAGDLVIDPFVGSGTTAVAAHITGRRFICGDQSPEYIEIARRRVFPEFGKPPKRAKEIKPLTDLPLFEGLI